MKYKIMILLLLIISLFVFSYVDASMKKDSLIGKTIFLDIGHGGKDPGTTYNKLYEKDLNLEVTRVLKSVLEEQGAIVLLTRDGDYDLASPNIYLRKRSDLANRAKLINDSNCHLYLSIHMNYYSSSKWRGVQTFYNNKNEYNKLLAESIEKSLKKDIKHTRDSKIIKDQYLYDHVIRPGILIEMGFLSNPDDRYLLKQKWYQKRLSFSIAKGILDYFAAY